MFDGYHHIELDGVPYRLAEDGEGDHYVVRGQSVRPPAASVVQGETNVFQLRQELVVWSLTDWSGGEGQIKFDPENPSRHWRLHNVDAFFRPGKLTPGPLEDSATNESDVDLTVALHMIGTDTSGALWAVSGESGAGGVKMYKNDEDGIRFTATAHSVTGGTTTPSFYGAVMVGDVAFFAMDRPGTNDDTLYYDTTLTANPATWNSDVPNVGDRRLAAVGNNLYIAGGGRVWEIPAAGTPPVASTLLDDEQDLLGSMTPVALATSSNRVFAVWTGNGYTIVREIVPTTAAGAGFGKTLAEFGGFKAQSAWVIGNNLYLAGTLNLEPVILYVSLGNLTYGTIGKIQPRLDGIPIETARAFFGGSVKGSFTEAWGYFGFQGEVSDGSSQTFNSTGQFEVPTGVTSVVIEAWGGGGGGAATVNPTAGGGGSDEGGGGGGGGAYASATVAVTGGQLIDVAIGAAGTKGLDTGTGLGTNGGDTTVTDNSTSTVLAKAAGGKRGGTSTANLRTSGPGGATADSVGDVLFKGGNGGTGNLTSPAGGGGGGGSALATNQGGNGANGLNSGRANGGGGEATGGKSGSASGSVSGHNALAGGAPGAGGGGGAVSLDTEGGEAYTTGDGGNGGTGRVKISWGTSVSNPGEAGESAIYVIDQVSGGVAQWATAQDSEGTDPRVYVYRDAVFYTIPTTETNPTRVVRPRHQDLLEESTAYFESGSWSFGLHDEKVLQALVLYTEPLPADWQLAVAVEFDDSGVWEQIGTYSEEDGRGTEIVVSTSTGSRLFRALRVRVEFERLANLGTTTDRPALVGVDAVATVTLPFLVWDLILDLADDVGGPGTRGNKKAETLRSAYQTGSVLQLKDGYGSRLSGEFTTHDVIVDGFDIINDRPGEGRAVVRLREIA